MSSAESRYLSLERKLLSNPDIKVEYDNVFKDYLQRNYMQAVGTVSEVGRSNDQYVGIGASTAIQFAKEGAEVTIVGRNEAKLNNVAAQISKVGKKPLIIKADVSNDGLAKTIVKRTVEKFGKLDVLVNNAGLIRNANVDDENLLEVYDEVVNTNLRSVVILTNQAAPHLIKTKGNIVNISSIAGSAVLSSFAKSGLLSYTDISSYPSTDSFHIRCTMDIMRPHPA